MIFVTDISIPWRMPARYPTRVFAVNPASLHRTLLLHALPTCLAF
jgi:hypothetical protein